MLMQWQRKSCVTSKKDYTRAEIRLKGGDEWREVMILTASSYPHQDGDEMRDHGTTTNRYGGRGDPPLPLLKPVRPTSQGNKRPHDDGGAGYYRLSVEQVKASTKYFEVLWVLRTTLR
jgi:hypothetical protein